MFSMKKIPSSLLVFLIIAACTGPAQRVSPDDLAVYRKGASSLVVVHSRSGNTAKMGLLVSEMLNADYIRLVVPEGSGDSFFSSPGRNSDVKYFPRDSVNLTKYRLVFLGSPIWYWHPTAFIYSFIRNNDLVGKKVVLFYTFEGGIARDAVGEWKELVNQRGGEVIDVVSINRKIHKTDEALLAEVAAQVKLKSSQWVDMRGK